MTMRVTVFTNCDSLPEFKKIDFFLNYKNRAQKETILHVCNSGLVKLLYWLKNNSEIVFFLKIRRNFFVTAGFTEFVLKIYQALGTNS